jgi:hypothetical protein
MEKHRLLRILWKYQPTGRRNREGPKYGGTLRQNRPRELDRDSGNDKPKNHVRVFVMRKS